MAASIALLVNAAFSAWVGLMYDPDLPLTDEQYAEFLGYANDTIRGNVDA